jgi:hypothetical protein
LSGVADCSLPPVAGAKGGGQGVSQMARAGLHCRLLGQASEAGMYHVLIRKPAPSAAAKVAKAAKA